jgi:hypothetical protein
VIFSVVLFGHNISLPQWGFAILVFLSAPISKHLILPLVGGSPKVASKKQTKD